MCTMEELRKVVFSSPFNREGVAIVFPDADITQAVVGIVEMLLHMLHHEGQDGEQHQEVVFCRHIFVHRSRWDEFLYELKARYEVLFYFIPNITPTDANISYYHIYIVEFIVSRIVKCI